MTSRDFCYWLQGLLEVGDVSQLNERQVNIIRQHLNMVFIHEIDPGFPEEQQESLNQAHGNPFQGGPGRPPKHQGRVAKC
jgi:hypothetical protein